MAIPAHAGSRTQKWRSRTDRWCGRREFMTAVGSTAIAWLHAAHAQQSPAAALKRVGSLSLRECQIPPDNAFLYRLGELGWFEGRNYVVDCVSAVGRVDQVPALARELVSRRPDVLVTSPASFVKALQQETATIPIVMLGTPDPVRLGIVTNLARPEGNVTGVAWFGFDILSKRIELLKEIVPHLTRLAIIAAVSDANITKAIEENVTRAARMLGFAWQRFEPAAANDYDEIFAALVANHFDAAYIQADPLNLQTQNRAHIAQLALRHFIPAVGERTELARDGLLLTYNQDFSRSAAHASEYVDKILRGAKPTELPVEQGANFELVINLKTAKALGLSVAPALLARASEVIE
jgi:putative tryptophan/tyrosine transport system substrate-binding protein